MIRKCVVCSRYIDPLANKQKKFCGAQCYRKLQQRLHPRKYKAYQKAYRNGRRAVELSLARKFGAFTPPTRGYP